MNLNLRQIQALVSIARLGSFTKAASTLHLSQPALTVQIHHLEDTLGMRLLDRNTRSVKLTAWGKEVVPIFEGVLQALEGVVANGARSAATATRGMVSVAALPWICVTRLAPLAAKFRRQNPSVSVTLRDAYARQVVAQVKDEEADFGIASVVEPDPAISMTPLITDHLKVVFAPGHPLKHLRTVDVKDLCRYPLIALSPGSSVRLLADQAFKSMGHEALPACEVAHTATALGLVKAGQGISIVSSSALTLNSTAGVLSRRIRHPGFVRTVSVIQKAGRRLSPAADSLLKTLLAEAAPLGTP